MCYFNSWMYIQYYKNMRDYTFEITMSFSKDCIFKVASKAGCIFKVASGATCLLGQSKAY